MSAYTVKLQTFEGPFELLISLIDKQKLSINEVSLAEVADQYLSYVKQIEQFPTDEVASFFVTAATLMLIKSRSLLPSLQLSDEEELEIHDLEERLRLYKAYKQIAKSLENIFGKHVLFAREPFAQINEVFVEPKDLTANRLEETLKEIISRLPKKEILPKTEVKKTISLEQRINDLIKKMEKKINFCFSEVSEKESCGKIDIIVDFLAILELVKRGLIMVQQNKGFGEINIKKHETV